jgi:hypothetical protein
MISFLCGHLKTPVYSVPTENEETLHERFTNAVVMPVKPLAIALALS